MRGVHFGRHSFIVIRAIIFDLDNCLAPSDGMGRDFLDPVLSAVRDANRGNVDDAELQAAFRDMWRTAFDAVAKKFGFSQEMFEAGWNAARQLEVRGAMRGYEDLGMLKKFRVPLYLVTSGFRRTQESKIKALGIEGDFVAVVVDAIDERERLGKQAIFAKIQAELGHEPREFLVVGDHPESEIAAGNRLGMQTAQILRPGVIRSDEAQHHIRDLGELHSLLSAMQ